MALFWACKPSRKEGSGRNSSNARCVGGDEVMDESIGLWWRDHGWYLEVFTPSPVDVFRLHRARCMHELQPDTVDSAHSWTFSALLVKKRPQNSKVVYADAQIVAIPVLEAGWRRWHSALIDPYTVCGVQIRWSRQDKNHIDGRKADASLWRYGSLFQPGTVARMRGCIARTLGGGCVVDIDTLQIIKCAPTPQCVSSILIEASATRQPGQQQQRKPLLSLEEAMLALHCTRIDIFDRLMQYATSSFTDDSTDGKKLSRRQRKRQRKQQLMAKQQQQGDDSDSDTGEPDRKRIRMAVSKKEKTDVARAQTAKRKALAAWARYLRGAEARRMRQRAARVNNGELDALAMVEAMPCSETYASREFPYELPSVETAEALQREIACGTLDPHKNLPVDADWKRLRYIELKKQPQVQWMCARIVALLAEMKRRNKDSGKPVCTRHIVDVGGGRGDLALAVAAAVPDDCVVCVVDTNAESLCAGQQRAEEEHLAHKMQFICDRIENIYRTLHCDLVIGLHACGGLSEFALRLAVEQQASFLVCTCCFNSNPFLAVLTRRECCEEESDAIASMCPDVAITDKLVPPLSVIKSISAVAERKATDSAEMYHRGMHAVNAIRLSVVAALFESMRGPQRTATIELCQTQFDKHWSGANCVVVGLVVHHTG